MNWSLDEDLAFYQRAGVHTVGVSLRKLEAEGVDSGVARIAGGGVRVADVIGLGPFSLDLPERWDDQRARVRTALEAARTLGAGCLVLTTGPAGSLTWEDAAGRLAAALTPVLPEARAAGVAIAIEHTNSLRLDVSFVHTLGDTVELARELGVGVCMEVNACWAERGLAATIRDGRDRLRLVQVSDFVIGTKQTPDRAVPGDGDIPLERVLGTILDAGYEGLFELELVGPRIEQEGYESAVTRSIEHLDRVLGRLLD